jgi:transcriptional regulator with XRE-family HTH domain
MYNWRNEAERKAVPKVGGLREIREARALTQGQLAQRAGLNMTTISRIENDLNRPTIPTLRALAQALDMSVADLETAINPQARVLRQEVEQLDQLAKAVGMAKDALSDGQVENTMRALDILEGAIREMAEDMREVARISRGEKKESASDRLNELLTEMKAG